MAFLKDSDREAIGKRLSALGQGVKLIVFTQEMECMFCKETRELMEEVGSLSNKVAVEVYDFVKDKEKAESFGIDKIPAIAVIAEDNTDYGIRFYGIPSGYEFMSLLESFDLVSSGDSGLAEPTRDKLKELKDPVNLQVFVTPTCPYCPQAVVLAFKFAVENPLITANMVEATEFPHLSTRYGIGGVPHTVISEEAEPLVGAQPEWTAVQAIIEAAAKK